MEFTHQEFGPSQIGWKPSEINDCLCQRDPIKACQKIAERHDPVEEFTATHSHLKQRMKPINPGPISVGIEQGISLVDIAVKWDR